MLEKKKSRISENVNSFWFWFQWWLWSLDTNAWPYYNVGVSFYKFITCWVTGLSGGKRQRKMLRKVWGWTCFQLKQKKRDKKKGWYAFWQQLLEITCFYNFPAS